MTSDDVKFEADLAADRANGEPALVVDVEGFEGPLDLLLTLARQQKVDLAKISILALADQYLAFVEEARKLRLELAADYLVMAAWLAYLKSRLLLPDTHAPEGQSAEDMAMALALRLKRLEAIRAVAQQLFERAAARSRCVSPRPARADRPHQASAVVGHALRSAVGLCAPAPAECARARALCQAHGLVAVRGARDARAPDRSDRRLDPSRRIPDRLSWSSPSHAATVLASSFASTLELVREGLMEVNQHTAFAPLYVRKRQRRTRGERPSRAWRRLPAGRD